MLRMPRACRALARNRGYAAAVVLTLALALGATSAIATVAWSVLLRPLPIANPEEVVLIYDYSATEPRVRQPIPYVFFQEWRRRSSAFADLAAMSPSNLKLPGGNGIEEVPAASVTDSFFPLLGVRPLEGRWLDTGDRESSDGAVACVVSVPFARRQFGAGSALRRTFDAPSPASEKNRIRLVVVGVMPEGFERWRDTVHVWLPAEAPGIMESRELTSHGMWSFYALGRLKPGVSPRQAHAEMEILDGHVRRDIGGVNNGFDGSRSRLRVLPLRDDVVPESRQRALWLFAAAAAFVLLIATANSSSLLLARFESRLVEIRVRQAIGASRLDIFRLVAGESLVLCAAGLLVGGLVGYASLRVLGVTAPEGISGQVVRFAPAVAVFTLGITVLVAFAMAALHQLVLRRLEHAPLLQGTPGHGSRRSSRLLHAMIVAEVAVSVLVVVAGGLLLRNFIRLQQTDLGFRPEGVLLTTFDASSSGPASVDALRTTLVRAAALPGVETAALTSSIPFDVMPPGRTSIRFDDGRKFLNGDEANVAKTPGLHLVSARYFAALGMSLRAGRFFTEADDSSAALVTVVNETFARIHWPRQSAIGKRIHYWRWRRSDAPRWAEVVGVVGDAQYVNRHEPSRPELYAPVLQASAIKDGPHMRRFRLLLTTPLPELGLAPAARAAILQADPRQRIIRVTTLGRAVALSVAEQRYQALLMGLFALLGAALAAIGVYSVLNHAVVRRTREIGIHMALGATTARVAEMVVRRGATLVLPGVAGGLLLALATTRVLSSLLYGVSARDPMTFMAAGFLFLVIAATACLLPSRRAARIDPTIALRAE